MGVMRLCSGLSCKLSSESWLCNREGSWCWGNELGAGLLEAKCFPADFSLQKDSVLLQSVF